MLTLGTFTQHNLEKSSHSNQKRKRNKVIHIGKEVKLSLFADDMIPYISPVQFSHSVMSDTLWPHESQHARAPCPLPIPRVYSNSCPSSWWCHPVISFSVVPFSSCPQSLPASESFPMSQHFEWHYQSIGVSASTSVFPMNTQDWSSLGWAELDLLAVQGTLKSLLQHYSSEALILWSSVLCIVQLSHPYMTSGKTIALTRWTFGSKVMSLLFNMLSMLAKRRVKKLA